jgi:hypothetical protein
LSDDVSVVLGFATAITAATVTGGAVDTQGYRRATAIVYQAPTGSGTTGACALYECATSGGTFTAVTGGTFAGSTTVGGAQTQIMNIDLARRQRYLQLQFTGAGGSAAGLANGFFILGEPATAGVTNTPTPVNV